MQKLKILNTRDIKKLKKLLVAAFGYALEKDYAYLKTERDRIYVVNKDISRIELDNLRIDRLGLYFAEWKNDHVRLSKEGAQLLLLEGESKVEHVITLDENEANEYFKGQDLTKDLGKDNKQIILKYKTDILGSATYKEGQILNFLPKMYRGTVIL
jgi:NOL1/NOP2/fmu family ribosome biogenesis protein